MKYQSLGLTGHSVGSTWGQVCFSQCLLSGIALNHPQQPWQRDREGLWNRKKNTKIVKTNAFMSDTVINSQLAMF